MTEMMNALDAFAAATAETSVLELKGRLAAAVSGAVTREKFEDRFSCEVLVDKDPAIWRPEKVCSGMTWPEEDQFMTPYGLRVVHWLRGMGYHTALSLHPHRDATANAKDTKLKITLTWRR